MLGHLVGVMGARGRGTACVTAARTLAMGRDMLRVGRGGSLSSQGSPSILRVSMAKTHDTKDRAMLAERHGDLAGIGEAMLGLVI